MISKTSDERRKPNSVLFRIASVTVVTALSVLMVATPSYANSLVSDPEKPAFVLGGPTPQMKLRSPSFDNPPTVETILLEVESGNNKWAPLNTCPTPSSQTSDLSKCGILSITSTIGGAQSVDHSANVRVSQENSGVKIVFNPPLGAVPNSPYTRVIEVTLLEGTFSSTPNAEGFEISMLITSAPNGGSYLSNGFFMISSGYSGVSFVGGAGSTGSMSSILFPSTSNLPANGFSKEGFNFAGWSCTEGGQVRLADQASLQSLGFGCDILYAVWAAPGSGTTPSGSATTPAGSTVSSVPTTKAASLATTGTSLSSWAPGLALALGLLMLVYSRSLRASRARHLKI